MAQLAADPLRPQLHLLPARNRMIDPTLRLNLVEQGLDAITSLLV